jgi:hypothetical protein
MMLVTPWHGTWVAGVLGVSADNDYDIVGVAPDATLAGFYARFGGAPRITGRSNRS